MKNTKKDKMKKPRGKITVSCITKDILKMLPNNTDDMTEEEIHRFAQEVFKRCVKHEGDPVDVSKLAKDYDEDELTYNSDTVVEGD
jgi:hypothetical protein